MFFEGRHIARGFAVSAAAAICISAMSQGALADVAPDNASDHVVIGISGYVTPKCELRVNGSSSVSLGEILDNRTGKAAPVSTDLGFHLECNAPYTAFLTSEHGGLAYEGASVHGFSSLVGYMASIDLSAPAGSLSLHCDSGNMHNSLPTAEHDSDDTSCHANSSGHGYSEGNGNVKVTLQSGTQPLLKGEYSDEVTVVVKPKL